MERKKLILHHYFRLILLSLFVGLVCALLAFSLKHITEHLEEKLFSLVKEYNPLLFIVFPTIGITAIYFLRKYFFQNRKNKGITEIYKTLDQRKDHLPFFKIPSHYLNGFLTVIFGGSTGVEVSTVVATATVGNMAYEQGFSAKIYKRELICAGVTAGVAVLFGSPLAGWLFAMEVIARKFDKSLAISCTASAVIAGIFILFFDNTPLLPYTLSGWKWAAIPFFIILSLLGGILSVYFTYLVIRVKDFFSKINNNFLRVNLGALIVGGILFLFPVLYGDSYHGLHEILNQALVHQNVSIALLLVLVLVKPVASALTLGAGGDGGVFAPSIVAGALLGLLFALVCNTYFNTHLIIINFVLVGAAATLSAAIYAPLTALFLVCSIVPNGYALFFPLLLGSFSAKLFAQRLLPYNVYTYGLESAK
ncbi:chloride channel protein [Elizabethkingia meningoseptica]|uniref:chloride channel protein n=1 Tax=Elizabethkingia meningoseptica TaxID=238 RepID=UPI000841EFE0|nr:chloride channel protein [Elizabethkingia meningoseptica]ODM52115.1 chloride channel protein [Elizabethkingia meningoseptica]OHT26271.1 chloride channel protein [Elizabethkingia meningoseptica]OPC08870.1 chloride channel protein [Elizabethkingia meningoseptica]